MSLLDDEQRKQELFYFKQRYFSTPANGSKASLAINMEEILQRKTEQIIEKSMEFPQNIFFVRLGLVTIVGRKLISQLSLSNRIKEFHCGSIKNYMILGILESFYNSPYEVKMDYHPLLTIEKIILFDRIKERNDLELIFPFCQCDNNRLKRRVYPKDGWPIDPTRMASLSAGEERMKQYTIHYLKQFDLDKKVLYDLSCANGSFLSAIKQEYPACYTLGQEFNRKMLEQAKGNMDEILVGDPFKPTAKEQCADFCFVRFLNANSVTLAQAKIFLYRLRKCLNDNGRIILFGQEPIFLTKKALETIGFEVENCKAYDKEEDAIFQYYVLKNNYAPSNVRIS